MYRPCKISLPSIGPMTVSKVNIGSQNTPRQMSLRSQRRSMPEALDADCPNGKHSPRQMEIRSQRMSMPEALDADCPNSKHTPRQMDFPSQRMSEVLDADCPHVARKLVVDSRSSSELLDHDFNEYDEGKFGPQNQAEIKRQTIKVCQFLEKDSGELLDKEIREIKDHVLRVVRWNIVLQNAISTLHQKHEIEALNGREFTPPVQMHLLHDSCRNEEAHREALQKESSKVQRLTNQIAQLNRQIKDQALVINRYEQLMYAGI